MAGRKKGTPKTGGRKKGTPNKIMGAIKDDVLWVFEQLGGRKDLLETADQDRLWFYTNFIKQLLPKAIDHSGEVNHNLTTNLLMIPTQMTTEEFEDSYEDLIKH